LDGGLQRRKTYDLGEILGGSNRKMYNFGFFV
jgi:hypothetical protein